MLSQGWAHPWAGPGLAERAARPGNKTRISRCICWRVPSSLYGRAAGMNRDLGHRSPQDTLTLSQSRDRIARHIDLSLLRILIYRRPWVLTLWPPMRILEVMQTLFHCQAGESTTLNHLQKASKRRNHLHNRSKYYLNSQYIDTCKYGQNWHSMFLPFRYGRLLKQELVNILPSGWREHQTQYSSES